jgi:uncharacterized protein (DUF4415 family)
MKKQKSRTKTDEEFLNEKFDFSKAVKRDGRPVKILKSMRFDADVLLWLHEEGQRQGIPYQTLAGQILRKAMGGQKDIEARLERVEKAVFKKASGDHQ